LGSIDDTISASRYTTALTLVSSKAILFLPTNAQILARLADSLLFNAMNKLCSGV